MQPLQGGGVGAWFFVSVFVVHGVSITSRSVAFARKYPVHPSLWGLPVRGKGKEEQGTGTGYVLTAHSRWVNPSRGPEDAKWSEVCSVAYPPSPTRAELPRTP